MKITSKNTLNDKCLKLWCQTLVGRERKNIANNEWKATKVHVHAQCFSISFPAWEGFLKFDTTAWNSYHRSTYCASTKVKSYWSMYCASAKVKSSPTAIVAMGPYICHQGIGPTVTQDFTVTKLAILTWRYLHLLKMRICNSFKPLLTWVLIKNVDTAVTKQISSWLATLELCKKAKVGMLLTS